MLHAYERGLDLVLRFSFTTLLVFFATLALSVYLFIIIPKGFFPQQDTGFLTATSEAAQDISFADMKRHQEELGEIVQEDPGGRQRGDGHRRRRQRAQHRPHVHHAEAARRARRQRATRSSRGCGRRLDKVEGAQAVPAGRAGRRGSAAAPRARSSSTRCRTPISTSSTSGRRRSWPR